LIQLLIAFRANFGGIPIDEGYIIIVYHIVVDGWWLRA